MTDYSLKYLKQLLDEGGAGDVTQEMLTTTSGDIVSQIPADYVTLIQHTTTSGDLVAQIPSLSGYATEAYVDNAVSTISGGGATSSGCDCDATEVSLVLFDPDGANNTSITDIVPTMASYTSPSPYVITYSDEYGGSPSTPAWNAFNDWGGDQSYGFWGADEVPVSIAVDLGVGNTKIVNKMRWRARDYTGRHGPRDWQIDGSNETSPTVDNDNHWTTLFSVEDQADPGQGAWSDWYTWVNSTAYRHYRMKITDRNVVGTTAVYIAVAEIELIGIRGNYISFSGESSVYDALITLDSNSIVSISGTGGIEVTSQSGIVTVDGSGVSGGGITEEQLTTTSGDIITYVDGQIATVNGCDCTSAEVTFSGVGVVSDGAYNAGEAYAMDDMTGYTTPFPNVVTANHDQSGQEAWRLFDRSTAPWRNAAAGQPSWIKFDFGTGNTKIINKYRVQSRDTWDDYPRTWEIQGSNNDSDWDTLSSVTDAYHVAPGNNWSPWYTFINSTPYRYYRWYITVSYNGNYCAAAQLQMVEASYSGDEVFDVLDVTVGDALRALEDIIVTATGIEGISVTTISGQMTIDGSGIDKYTQAEIDSFLITTSGDVVAQIPSLTGYATEVWVAEQGFVDLADLTTTSGDIIAQIGGGGDVTLEMLTTTSGDIIDQIPSLAGYATETYVDNAVSTISGGGGITDSKMQNSFVMLTWKSEPEYDVFDDVWVDGFYTRLGIDPSTFVADYNEDGGYISKTVSGTSQETIIDPDAYTDIEIYDYKGSIVSWEQLSGQYGRFVDSGGYGVSLGPGNTASGVQAGMLVRFSDSDSNILTISGNGDAAGAVMLFPAHSSGSVVSIHGIQISSDQVYLQVGSVRSDPSVIGGEETFVDYNANINGYHIRIVLHNSWWSGEGLGQIRVVLEGNETYPLYCDNLSIVERSGSTSNGTEVPTELFFDGLSGCSNINNTSQTSDWINFEIDSSKDYLLCMDISTQAVYRRHVGKSANFGYYYATSTNAYDQQNFSGSWSATWHTYVLKLETRYSVIPSGIFVAGTSEIETLWTRSWSEVEGIIPTELSTDGSKEAYYAIRFDSVPPWKVFKNSAFREVVRLSSGTWQYKDNTDAWNNADVNDELLAIGQAMTYSGNQMVDSELTAMSSSDWSSSGGFTADTTYAVDLACGLDADGENYPYLDKYTATYSQYNNDITMITRTWRAAAADPEEAYCILDLESTEPYILDTDLKVFVTTDSGSNYSQITGLSTFRQKEGHDYVRGDISSLPARSDQTMALKITTHNNKDVKIHGISIGIP